MQRKAIQNAFDFRFATKVYKPDIKIPKGDFDIILDSARFSPSSFGLEPWNLIVIQSEEIRQEFLEAGTWGARGTLPTASHFVVITAKTETGLIEGGHIERIQREVRNQSKDAVEEVITKFNSWRENDFELKDPQLVHQWAARQAYIALGNMMTTAAMLQIDSQPIEGFSISKIATILTKHDLMHPEFDRPAVMVSFGYRDMQQPERARRSIDEIVRWA